jgi:glycosyltransferase involved in cell wall biosynthesis
MRRPRVLIDASCLSDGRAGAGIGRYARELIAALRRRDDVDIEVAVPRTAPRSESRPGRFAHAHPAVLAAAIRYRPQLLHSLGGEPVLGFAPSRQVITVHDVQLWRQPGSGGVRGALLRGYARGLAPLYRRTGALIAVSASSADEAAETLRLQRSRIRVVPHGIAASFTSTPAADDGVVRATLGLHGGYVLWSGSLRHHDPRKGLDVLLAAMSHLQPPTTLALAGAGGAEAERLAALARRLGVAMVLTGPLQDRALAAVYRGAAALALASYHEGFGLPALEAMACGTPVVATTAGNLPALTAGAAVLVAPGDPAALASGLHRVLADPALAADRREAGLARARRFSWDRAAELTAAVYCDLAGVG